MQGSQEQVRWWETTCWICSQTSLPWAKHGSKWRGQRSHACYSAFALTAQQLMVAHGLHEPYHAVVLCGQTLHVPCAVFFGSWSHSLLYRQKLKSYVSRLLQQNIRLSEVSLILRLLPSFSDFHTKCYAITSSCTALQTLSNMHVTFDLFTSCRVCSQKWGLAANPGHTCHQTLVRRARVVLSSEEYSMVQSMVQSMDSL